MDGVLVLAATNIPWQLDAAIRRRYMFTIILLVIMKIKKNIYDWIVMDSIDYRFTNKYKTIDHSIH